MSDTPLTAIDCQSLLYTHELKAEKAPLGSQAQWTVDTESKRNIIYWLEVILTANKGSKLETCS